MLLHIRDFIQREKVASTQQLSRAFHIDEAALQPMLDIWIAKAVIKPCQEKPACQSACSRCKTSAPVFYEMVYE